MAKNIALHALKLLGVGLFIWILSTLDGKHILHVLSEAHTPLIVLSFCMIFGIYSIKTWRWHTLINMLPIHTPFSRSWRIYNIGVFLATITPAKLGEFGKAAYLMQAGMQKHMAITVTLIDRVTDVIVIGILGILALGVVFGIPWLIGGLIIAGTIGGIGWYILRQKKVVRLALFVLPFIDNETIGNTIAKLLGITLLSWSLYFLWAVTLATAVGISLSPLILIAAFIFVGIVSLLPIAPSGLGTRDAALLFLLTPYGIEPETIISLAVLMFTSIVLSGILGGWYWIRGV